MLASFSFDSRSLSGTSRCKSTKAPFSQCSTALKGFRLALDDITKLIDAGREKGYLTYNEVNNLIPHDVHSPEALDDLLATIGTRGIDVLAGQPKLASSALKKQFDKEVEAGDEVELDLTPALLKRPTIRCACTCARWAQCLCSPAKGKWTLPSASSADSCAR